MSHMTIAMLSVGAGILVAIITIFASMTATGLRQLSRKMQVAGKDLCAICGRPIPRNTVYCRDHRHLAALRRTRPLDD
ncbi:MAG: hypothetical protein ACE5R4_13615 [Armatimonadota bacterium]